MIFRTVVLASGLCGALAAAQFPAYSQQYYQRLGGAVQALGQVVADFDASAAALGMTRAQALSQMQGTSFIEARRADMRRSFARYDSLRADLAALQGQGPFMRAYLSARMTDPEIARGTLAAFHPGLPLSLAGGMFALIGFLATAAAARLALGMIRPRRPRQVAA
jgi:hypothetical protein